MWCLNLVIIGVIIIASCFLIVIDTSLSHGISFHGRGFVAGVTVCNEKLFVLRGESKERIQQFNLQALNELESISVNGLSDDYWDKSLTSCNVNSCLYINDLSMCSVWI